MDRLWIDDCVHRNCCVVDCGTNGGFAFFVAARARTICANHLEQKIRVCLLEFCSEDCPKTAPAYARACEEKTMKDTQKQPYEAPKLELQAQYVALTGVSLPIGTLAQEGETQ
jgi:hypothetical protein